jgi:ferric-dicitrate binding protein FerR (iron transport regulator)
MTVVGTKFNVTTSQGWTRLQVLEGTVRARRLSDGATVDVSFDSTHGPEYVDVAHPGVRPPPAPNGMDMSKYWSTDIRPAGINQ